METVDIFFDQNRTLELYRRYFQYEREKEFKKVPSKIFFGFSAILIVLGFVFSIDLLWMIGLTSAILVGLFLAYYFVRFEMVFK